MDGHGRRMSAIPPAEGPERRSFHTNSRSTRNGWGLMGIPANETDLGAALLERAQPVARARTNSHYGGNKAAIMTMGHIPAN